MTKIIMTKTLVLTLVVILGAVADAQHSENAVVPEENFVEESLMTQAECNVFGALDKETAVPMNLYKIAGELLKEAKATIGTELKGVLECGKWKSYWKKRSCKKIEKGVLTGIKNLNAKELIDLLVVALKPHAVAFFHADEYKEIHVLAETFSKAKPMEPKKAETFVANHLSTELGQILSTLQEPMMKLIPTILFNFIPGWSFVPSDWKTMIIDKVHSDTKAAAGDAHGELTEKFKELMHKTAAHIIKVTAIGEMVTDVIMDTPAICAYDLAQKFAMTATTTQC